MKRLSTALALSVLCLLAVTIGAETDAPEPDTVPATAEKSYNDLAVVRTSYFTDDGSPGELNCRVRLANLVDAAHGYELHPNEQKGHSFKIDNVATLAAQSSRFKLAFVEFHRVLVLLANRDFYTQRIARTLEENPNADVSADQAKLAVVNTALQISP